MYCEEKFLNSNEFDASSILAPRYEDEWTAEDNIQNVFFSNPVNFVYACFEFNKTFDETILSLTSQTIYIMKVDCFVVLEYNDI